MSKLPKTLLGRHWKKVITELSVYKKSALERGIKDETDKIEQTYKEYCLAKRNVDQLSIKSHDHGTSSEAVELRGKLRFLESQLCELAYCLPNKIHSDTPIGPADNNKVVCHSRKSHEMPEALQQNDKTKKINHIEFYERLNAINFSKAASISGSKFVYLMGQGF